MNNEIIIAEHAGFCFGVKRTVEAIEEALKNHKNVWTIGSPIHNPQEVSRLSELGLNIADNENEIPENAVVLIRAHGEALEVLENLKSRGVKVIDMTCPFVKKAQEMASEFSDKKHYQIVLLGDKNHPEIIGIKGHVKNSNPEIIANEDEAELLRNYSKIALISQTTQRIENLSKVSAVLVKKCGELHVCNTICRATSERQDAVKKINADGVVLVGGKTSANTKKLNDILKNKNLSVLWIEEPEELNKNLKWFENKKKIGIAAGASTPSWLIINTKNKIAQIQGSQGGFI